VNNLSRLLVVLTSAAICAGGVIQHNQHASSPFTSGTDLLFGAEFVSNFEFASSDLHKFSFAQLEEIVRSDAASRFPNARVELGSVKAERDALTMNVVLFGPNQQTMAFLYRLVPEKNSWKIASTQRLWFVPPAQIARGLRV
jgi:uncharacterized protein DUF4864